MKRTTTLIHHQNATCGVAFGCITLRRMPNTPQALQPLRLASGILLMIRKLMECNGCGPTIAGEGYESNHPF